MLKWGLLDLFGVSGAVCIVGESFVDEIHGKMAKGAPIPPDFWEVPKGFVFFPFVFLLFFYSSKKVFHLFFFLRSLAP